MQLDLQGYQQKMVSLRSQTPYSVQFLLKESVDIDPAGLLSLLRKHCGNVDQMNAESGMLAFAFMDHLTQFNEGRMPAQCLFSGFEALEDAPAAFRQSLDQTWDWGQAAAVVQEAKTVFSVTDMLAGGLERKARLNIVHGVVRSILELLPSVLAVHWLPSQRMVEPRAYLEGMHHGGRLYASALNVRVFKVQGAEDETIMDTMGLMSFGLADFQCHFRKLSLWDVGMLLYNLGEFLFDRGEVIRDGDTIEGVQKTDRWKCARELALVEPRRVVIDISPGEFSAPR